MPDYSLMNDGCVRLLTPTVGHATPLAYSELRFLPVEQVHELFVLVFNI